MKKLMLILIVVLLLMLAFAGPVFAGPPGEAIECEGLIRAANIQSEKNNTRAFANIQEVLDRLPDCEATGGGE